MEDSDMKAIREIANGMEYVASEAMKFAPYDKTRNGRITKVYYETGVNTIIGYDFNLDGKEYHLKKEQGRGIIAKENDVVKVHFPCNNSNYMYLSYPHDPEDFIKYFVSSEGEEYYLIWNTGRYEHIITSTLNLTFPATTKQFSSTSISYSIFLPQTAGIPYDFIISCDNGVQGVVTDHNVLVGSSINIKFYNENPTTTTPVTKEVKVYVKAMGIVYATS